MNRSPGEPVIRASMVPMASAGRRCRHRFDLRCESPKLKFTGKHLTDSLLRDVITALGPPPSDNEAVDHHTVWRDISMSASTRLPPADCPLCREPGSLRKKGKRLYGGIVCKKCFYKFVNRRQGAYLIDSFAMYVVGILLGYYIQLAAPIGGMMTAGASIFGVLYQLAFNAAFFMKDGFGGKSPGRWLTGITVVDAKTRDPIGFAQSFKRNLPLLIPFSPFIIMFTMGKGPRWGDKWANTRVVWDKFKHQFPFEDRGMICTLCGYDLTGNVSGICPECGTPVPPSQEGYLPPKARPV